MTQESSMANLRPLPQFWDALDEKSRRSILAIRRPQLVHTYPCDNCITLISNAAPILNYSPNGDFGGVFSPFDNIPTAINASKPFSQQNRHHHNTGGGINGNGGVGNPNSNNNGGGNMNNNNSNNYPSSSFPPPQQQQQSSTSPQQTIPPQPQQTSLILHKLNDGSWITHEYLQANAVHRSVLRYSYRPREMFFEYMGPVEGEHCFRWLSRIATRMGGKTSTLLDKSALTSNSSSTVGENQDQELFDTSLASLTLDNSKNNPLLFNNNSNNNKSGNNSSTAIIVSKTGGSGTLPDSSTNRPCWYCSTKVWVQFLDMTTYPRPPRMFKMLLCKDDRIRALRQVIAAEINIPVDRISLRYSNRDVTNDETATIAALGVINHGTIIISKKLNIPPPSTADNGVDTTEETVNEVTSEASTLSTTPPLTTEVDDNANESEPPVLMHESTVPSAVILSSSSKETISTIEARKKPNNNTDISVVEEVLPSSNDELILKPVNNDAVVPSSLSTNTSNSSNVRRTKSGEPTNNSNSLVSFNNLTTTKGYKGNINDAPFDVIDNIMDPDFEYKESTALSVIVSIFANTPLDPNYNFGSVNNALAYHNPNMVPTMSPPPNNATPSKRTNSNTNNNSNNNNVVPKLTNDENAPVPVASLTSSSSSSKTNAPVAVSSCASITFPPRAPAHKQKDQNRALVDQLLTSGDLSSAPPLSKTGPVASVDRRHGYSIIGAMLSHLAYENVIYAWNAERIALARQAELLAELDAEEERLSSKKGKNKNKDKGKDKSTNAASKGTTNKEKSAPVPAPAVPVASADITKKEKDNAPVNGKGNTNAKEKDKVSTGNTGNKKADNNSKTTPTKVSNAKTTIDAWANEELDDSITEQTSSTKKGGVNAHTVTPGLGELSWDDFETTGPTSNSKTKNGKGIGNANSSFVTMDNNEGDWESTNKKKDKRKTGTANTTADYTTTNYSNTNVGNSTGTSAGTSNSRPVTTTTNSATNVINTTNNTKRNPTNVSVTVSNIVQPPVIPSSSSSNIVVPPTVNTGSNKVGGKGISSVNTSTSTVKTNSSHYETGKVVVPVASTNTVPVPVTSTITNGKGVLSSTPHNNKPVQSIPSNGTTKLTNNVTNNNVNMREDGLSKTNTTPVNKTKPVAAVDVPTVSLLSSSISTEAPVFQPSSMLGKSGNTSPSSSTILGNTTMDITTKCTSCNTIVTMPANFCFNCGSRVVYGSNTSTNDTPTSSSGLSLSSPPFTANAGSPITGKNVGQNISGNSLFGLSSNTNLLGNSGSTGANNDAGSSWLDLLNKSASTTSNNSFPSLSASSTGNYPDIPNLVSSLPPTAHNLLEMLGVDLPFDDNTLNLQAATFQPKATPTGQSPSSVSSHSPLANTHVSTSITNTPLSSYFNQFGNSATLGNPTSLNKNGTNDWSTAAAISSLSNQNSSNNNSGNNNPLASFIPSSSTLPNNDQFNQILLNNYLLQQQQQQQQGGSSPSSNMNKNNRTLLPRNMNNTNNNNNSLFSSSFDTNLGSSLLSSSASNILPFGNGLGTMNNNNNNNNSNSNDNNNNNSLLLPLLGNIGGNNSVVPSSVGSTIPFSFSGFGSNNGNGNSNNSNNNPLLSTNPLSLLNFGTPTTNTNPLLMGGGGTTTTGSTGEATHIQVNATNDLLRLPFFTGLDGIINNNNK